MEENLIIQSTRSFVKPLKVIVCIFLVIGIIGLLLTFVISPAVYQSAEKLEDYNGNVKWGNIDEWGKLMDTGYNTREIGIVVYLIGGISFVVFLIILLAIAKMEINVTDKRVYGKAGFGKRVDLPLDSISAVATGIIKGIAVATSSGKIHFIGISNNEEIHEEISKLLIERQSKEKPVTATTIKQEVPQSNADELKKFKELLDSGVITQEEFDAKKKQLLGL